MSTETMLRLYKAFILPHFYYCSMVWHFSRKQDSDKLDLLNKRILRFIFKDFKSEYNNLLKKAGTANLKDKRLQNMIQMILTTGAPNGNFRENICSKDDLRSRIFGEFVVKFLACLPLLGFSNIYKMV